MYEDMLSDFDKLYPDKAFLTVDEIAKLLDVSRNVVYNMTKRPDERKRPPRVYIGQNIRFPKTRFLKWLISVELKEFIRTNETN